MDMKLVCSDKIPIKVYLFCYDQENFEQDLPTVS